jgi:uncharacterized protein YndB with AHSA1/START domain
MKPTPPAADLALVVRRAFAARREQVFSAWTDPDVLLAWFRPARDWVTTGVDVDLRTGGGFRISMQAPDGRIVILCGTYLEIDPPKKLAFTWVHEGSDKDETLVTVEFREQSGVTEVTVTHARFADEAARDRHERGWQASLQNLVLVLENGGKG